MPNRRALADRRRPDTVTEVVVSQRDPAEHPIAFHGVLNVLDRAAAPAARSSTSCRA